MDHKSGKITVPFLSGHDDSIREFIHYLSAERNASPTLPSLPERFGDLRFFCEAQDYVFPLREILK